MQFDGARWSLGGPGRSLGAARGLPGGFGAQNECFGKLMKSSFLFPGDNRGGFLGVLCVIGPPVVLGW